MSYEIFILPLLTISIGYIMFNYPPKKINHFVGYRTFRSMKNENNWIFANKYCGKSWIIIGIIMLIITIILFLLNHLKIVNITEDIMLIIVFCEIFAIISPTFVIEKRLKNNKIL